MTVWKYEITTSGTIELSLPAGAKILTIREQRGIPCLWALVDPAADKEEVIFHIYGTGHNMPADPGEYIGTYFVHEGLYVFHVFKPR